ncbi:MAG TPA: restriction endonuclease subunit S [Longimicrobium sp.]|jgi:type I restriction enzyme S subunit|uniref:restriction endonuclease subunit S n=1 Tax=Longimicrobium sp. TaxID=2029185 RepID=UPI002EDAEE6C
MSFPRYPRYKASGVEWLGEVPEHWAVTALKHKYEVTLGKMLQPERQSSDDELLPYLRAANIQWDGVDTTDVKQMWFSPRESSELVVRRGDLLVSEGGDVGRSCVFTSEEETYRFQNSVNRVRSRRGDSTKFLYYWMATIKAKGFVDVLCNKSTIAHFTAEKVAAVPVPVPLRGEQAAIVEFLDHETTSIDALIAEQQRLIELLKEKRQAVISHAVTRGLNPDAPMKPSGVEWLGDVPAHWDIVRMKFLCDIQTGNRDTENAVLEGAFPFFVRSQTVERIDSMAFDCEAIFTAGDGAGVGKVFHYYCGPFDFHQRVYMLNNFRRVEGRFLFHYFREQFYKIALEGGAKSTVDSLRRPMLTNFAVCVPPISEQSAIIAAVEAEAVAYDSLIADAERSITLLQERRTALISAAVTGKIDVRGIAMAEAA